MNLRIPVLLIVASSCLYCSAARQRESRTTATVGGGYLRAGDSSYGCGGELLSTQDHRQRVGSVGVEHEDDSGWSAAAELAAGQGEVVGFSAVPNNGQPALPAEAPLPNYRLLAGHARIGWDLSWIGAELGLQVLGDRIGALPFGLLRAGSLDQGLSVELQAGRRRALADPTLATIGVVYKAGDTRFKAAAGAMGRTLERYRADGQRLRSEGLSVGSFSQDMDLGVLLDWETWLDERLAVRVGAVLGEQWGATIDLVMALAGSSAQAAEIRMRPQPLPRSPGTAQPPPPAATPPPAEPSAPAGPLPPVAEPQTPPPPQPR